MGRRRTGGHRQDIRLIATGREPAAPMAHLQRLRLEPRGALVTEIEMTDDWTIWVNSAETEPIFLVQWTLTIVAGDWF